MACTVCRSLKTFQRPTRLGIADRTPLLPWPGTEPCCPQRLARPARSSQTAEALDVHWRTAERQKGLKEVLAVCVLVATAADATVVGEAAAVLAAAVAAAAAAAVASATAAAAGVDAASAAAVAD